VPTTIRLTRMGRKKRPFYRLVVMDSRKRRDGAYLANLGYYNPFTDPHEVNLQSADIIAWMSKGATVSETARSLLKGEGILYQFSLVKQGLEPATIEDKMTEWRTAADANRQKRVDAKAARIASKEAEAKAAADAEAEAKAAEEAAAKAAAKAEADAAAAAAAAAEAEAKAAAEAEAAAEAPAEEAPAEEAPAAEAPAAEAAAAEAPAAEDTADGDADTAADEKGDK